jgi:hypothetical protein
MKENNVSGHQLLPPDWILVASQFAHGVFLHSLLHYLRLGKYLCATAGIFWLMDLHKWVNFVELRQGFYRGAIEPH